MKLKSIKLKADTIAEAEKQVKNPAGKEEYEYVLAHPDKFPEFKDGNWYYFFGGLGGDERVPYLIGRGGGFWRGSIHRGSRWDGGDRAVLRDLSLPIESLSEIDTLKLALPDVLEINGIKYKKVNEYENNN